MTVSIQTPSNSYTGNGSTKIFPYTFKITSVNDIKVYIQGVLQPSGYTVSGVNSNTGGNINFTTAPITGTNVVIRRSTTLERNTDYIEGGSLDAAILDSDIDRVVLMIQDLNRDIGEASLIGHTHEYSELTSKPTTLVGYGITDAALASHNHDLVYSSINHTHTFADIVSKPTTLAGYGITDAAVASHNHDSSYVLTSAVIGVANGGTGQTTANAALNALLPIQTSNSGKVLTTDGTNVSWATVSGVPNIVRQVSSQANSTVTLANATNLVFTGLDAGTYYHFKFVVVYQSAATTTGIKLALTYPNISYLSANTDTLFAADGTGAVYCGAMTSSADAVISTGVPAANTNYVATIEGVLYTSGTGALRVQFASEVASSAVTIMDGSVGFLTNLGT